MCWIYVSEIPTARLRGLNVSLAAATQWLFNLVIARAVPNMLTTMGEGGYGAFIAFSCFCFSMFFFVWFLIPETKQIPLEEIDVLFGGANHVDKGADILGIPEAKSHGLGAVQQRENSREETTV